jgi:hypothetical protein
MILCVRIFFNLHPLTVKEYLNDELKINFVK